ARSERDATHREAHDSLLAAAGHAHLVVDRTGAGLRRAAVGRAHRAPAECRRAAAGHPDRYVTLDAAWLTLGASAPGSRKGDCRNAVVGPPDAAGWCRPAHCRGE